MNWDSICYVLKSFGIKEAARKKFTDAFSILLLEEDVLDDPYTMYICLDQNVQQQFEKALIVSVGTKAAVSDNYIILERGSPAAVCNALVQSENYLDTLNNLLGNASSEQEIIDIAGSYLGNPFFYFDESYRILAITGDFSPEEDEEWKYMTSQRFLSPDSIRKMTESGDLDRLAASTKPVVYDADFFPFVSIVTNITYQDQPYARLNRLCITGKVTPVMQEECQIVANNLHRLLTMRTTFSYRGPNDMMLRDLLKGIMLPEPLIRQRLKIQSEVPCFCVSVIDVNSGSDVHVPLYYSVLAGRIFREGSVTSLIYEGNVVLIFRAENVEGLEESVSVLRTFLKQQKLRGGISEVFQKMNSLKVYYEQAFAALNYAQPETAAVFSDIMIDHLIRLIPDSRREMFASYDLETLKEKQAACSFPLMETLRVYLETGCSLQKSAERLYLHKNTMLYRINKIRDILRVDLEDPGQRMRLIICLKMEE